MRERENIILKLVNDYAPWSETRAVNGDYNLWMKGYAFIDQQYHSGETLARNVSNCLDQAPSEAHISTLMDLIPRLNGCWALVYESHGIALAAVDRIRSIPLFYANENGKVFLSDDAGEILKEMPNATLDDVCAAEFLVTGFVTGRDTLHQGLYQIQPGEILKVNTTNSNFPEIDTHRYYRFFPKRYCDSSEHELQEELCDLFHRVFSRYAAALKGRTPVVPLSGGLDSRLIAAMLKKCGVQDVICFSYGRHINTESEISRAVAEALGYKWLFSPYDYPSWHKWIREQSLLEYIEYAGNRSSLFIIQDWPATREILINLSHSQVAFMPGHSLDMLAGSHIPGNLFNARDNARYSILVPEAILSHHYELWPWRNSNSSLEQLFLERIESVIPALTDTDRCGAIAAYENWDFENRQARYIINSLRAYEFYGCEWMLPWWDYDLMDFFLKIQPDLRYQKRLYRQTLFHKVFVNNMSDLRSIPVLGLPLSHSISRNANSRMYSNYARQSLKRILPGVLRDIIHSFCTYRGDYLKRYGRWKFIRENDALSYFRLLYCRLGHVLLDSPSRMLTVQSILEPQRSRSILNCHINGLNSAYYLLKLIEVDSRGIAYI